MKKAICLFLVACLLSSTALVAFASSSEFIPDWLAFTYDTANTIAGYNGSEEQFNSYMENTAQAAKYGAVVQALEKVKESDIGALPRHPMNVIFHGTLNPTIEKYDGKFRAMVANRDYIDGLYTLTNGSGENNRFKGLSEYGITISGDYDINTDVQIIGSPLIGQNANSCTAYIDISAAKSKTKATFFSGGNSPPFVVIPNGSTTNIYENGSKLYAGRIYYLLANNYLVGNVGTLNSYYLPFIYNYDSNDVNKIRLAAHYGNTVNYNPDTGYYSTGSVGSFFSYRTFINAQVGSNPPSYEEGLQILDLFEKCIGINLSFDNDTTIPVPSDIPYDVNNNVIVMIPTTNNTDVTYNHVYYMPVNTYKNYIDNSQATYNDYQYDETNTTINNIINMYFGDSGGGDFDDSRIVNRLDTIIGKLNDILSIMGKFSGEIFSNTPIYDKFTDCITNHVNYIDEYSDISTTLTPNQTNDGIEEIGIYYDSDDEPNELGVDRLTVNVGWYEKYRLRVRTLMKIPVIMICIAYTWTIFKRSFGVGE